MSKKPAQSPLKGKALYAAALRIARLAHRGQERKKPDGRAYIEHCLDVVKMMPEGDWTLRTVAILHDTIEDTTGKPARGSAPHRKVGGAYRVTAETLREDGMPEEVIAAVEAMTKPEETKDYLGYVRSKVMPNDLARPVKIADNYVNLRDRLRALMDGELSDKARASAADKVRNYLQSLEILTGGQVVRAANGRTCDLTP